MNGLVCGVRRFIYACFIVRFLGLLNFCLSCLGLVMFVMGS